MEIRNLKHTDLQVSRACFGTMTFGSQVDEAAAMRIVDTCLDGGVNFFDTANVYNLGASEIIVGNCLKGRRDKVVLASKVAGKMGDAGPSGLSKAAITQSIDDSLRRLQTDYLDLYYLHLPDYSVPIEESLAAMDQVVKQGKVRYPASSNYSGWQVCQMQWIAGKNDYKPAKVTQPIYNLLARGIEQEYLPMAKEFGISTVVYNPLAGGMLTGKQKREAPPLPGTRFDGNQMYLNRYWHEQDFDAVAELLDIADRAGRSPVSLALNWLLHHTATDSVILGASRIEQMEENLRVFDHGALSADTVAACDAVWKRIRGVTPIYNR